MVTEPFQKLMDDFVQRHPDASANGTVDADTRRFTRQVYELFEQNADMFRALVAGAPPSVDESRPGLAGLTVFFDQAVDQVQRRYEAAELAPPLDLRIAVRLGFGMIASSVLLRGSLFPDWTPDREAMVHALEHLVAHSLTGPPD